MTIEILPARLANQIAAGEVVERPASVIKELVENSLDAGADKIHIDIEKGGAKLIRITDNGCGIVKDELMLALSRHATSKIKDLNDLEAISSLGFRGEALASISSVARLTLTSKPSEQANAWQAYAQGRDMEVTIQPAAHPNGTTIEVCDLFFNTPARRKFLRTEKTEFNHIDEIVKRIALARFDVAITLTHNGKVIRQYRQAKQKAQFAKRIAMVCGQKFVEQAIEIDCPHDNMHLWGWIAKPSFFRAQNDLCYSYVNGRMMRDKLINHGIRQAYSDLLPSDSYPAFVLYLDLDHKDVDVNVHPAKHEVRFHQGRYVHDFIYSVCHKALQANLTIDFNEHGNEASAVSAEQAFTESVANAMSPQATGTVSGYQRQHMHEPQQGASQDYDRSYVQPLQRVAEASSVPSYSSSCQNPNQGSYQGASQYSYQGSYKGNTPSHQAKQAYQDLITSISNANGESSAGKPGVNSSATNQNDQNVQLLKFVDKRYALLMLGDEIKLLDAKSLSIDINQQIIENRWQQGFTSQPLLLPVVVSVDNEAYNLLPTVVSQLEHVGIITQQQGNGKIQIRQYPAILREQDVAQSFHTILQGLVQASIHAEQASQEALESIDSLLKGLIAQVMTADDYDNVSVGQLINQLKAMVGDDYLAQLRLKSVDLDLTSTISKLS